MGNAIGSADPVLFLFGGNLKTPPRRHHWPQNW